MKKILFTVLLVLSSPSSLWASDQQAEGLVSVQSPFSVEETANRMEQVLNEKGMTVFNRVNHSEAAKKVGLALRDTVLIMFGNPKAGSPLMQCQQTVAIDFPQKALIWKDENADVWVSYNQPSYLKSRHLMQGCEQNIVKITKALEAIVKQSVE